jgi:drug/metabolite transporter (DMT)-like permease
VILGMIVLHEKLDWRTIAGGVMIVVGIANIVVRKNKAKGSADLPIRPSEA